MSGGFQFDFSIRLGDIIVLFGFVIAGVIAFTSLRSSLKYFSDMFGFRLDIVDATLVDLKTEYINGKLQDSKIKRLEDDQALMRRHIDDLQRGRGYIQKDLDGEYMRNRKLANEDQNG